MTSNKELSAVSECWKLHAVYSGTSMIFQLGSDQSRNFRLLVIFHEATRPCANCIVMFIG